MFFTSITQLKKKTRNLVYKQYGSINKLFDSERFILKTDIIEKQSCFFQNTKLNILNFDNQQFILSATKPKSV